MLENASEGKVIIQKEISDVSYLTVIDRPLNQKGLTSMIGTIKISSETKQLFIPFVQFSLLLLISLLAVITLC